MVCTEILVYFFVWIASVLYSIYKFASTTYKYFRYYKDDYNDFTEGVSFLPQKRDKSDIEFESISFLIQNYFPWLLIYIIISILIQYYNKSIKVFKWWQIFFTSFYVIIKWNFTYLTLLLAQPILFHSVKYIRENKSIIWIINIVSLVLLNYLKVLANKINLNYNDYEIYVLISSLFWMNLKCTSFYTENIYNNRLIDSLSYCLYPPTVFSGPFILYTDFKNCYDFNKPFILWEFKVLVSNVIKALLWYFFLYLSLHFVYVNAATYQTQLIEHFDNWSFYGFGYTMGQYFHLKYIVVYGLSTSIASFDHINVPSLPRCIGRIHLYSDMWRYFDPGLYNFLTRNIYRPISELTDYKLISSFFCFLFVYVWHGLETHILIWSVLNYLGIVCENLFWPKKEKDKTKTRTNLLNWKRRKDCLIAAFLLVVSAVSNFYFFAGTEVGNVFFRRILKDTFGWGNILLIATLYCCCQISSEIRPFPARRM